MDSTKLCQICNITEFKYTCPKCNTLYCSVACYRSPDHQQCSETFYRDCVTEELALRSSNPRDPKNIEQVHNMYEVLQRMNGTLSAESEDEADFMNGEEDDGEEGLDSDDDNDSDREDEDGTDLASRLDGIDLDNPDAVWNCLTPSEKQEFESLLKTGDIQKIIPTFQPWWEVQMTKKLIEELDDGNQKPQELRHPPPLENITPFNIIMKKAPSPCLPNNLYNILSSYTLTVRFFNGDHHQSCLEATRHLIECSATLKNNANFDDTEQAVKSVIAECSICEIVPPAWEAIAFDVEKIMEGPLVGKRDPIYVKAALSDIHRLMNTAKHLAEKTISSDKSIAGVLEKKKITAVIKKIEFFLSFANETRSE